MCSSTNSNCRTTRSVLCLDMDNFANFCLEHGLEIDLASIFVSVALILDNWERPDLTLSFGDIAALPSQIKKYQLRRMACVEEQQCVVHVTACQQIELLLHAGCMRRKNS